MPRVEVILDSFAVEEKEGESVGLLKGRVVHTPSGVYDNPLSFTLPEDGEVVVVVDGESIELPLGAVSIEKGVIEGRIPLASGNSVKEIGLILDIGGIRIFSPPFAVPFLELYPESLNGSIGEEYGFSVVVQNCPPHVVYPWDFGYGNIAETEGTSLSHVYVKEGEYHLQVTMQDPAAGRTLAVARGRAYISPAQIETIQEEGPLGPNLLLPVEDEEARRQRILAEYRLLYPEYLPWFYNYKGRIELVANAEEVGLNLYRVAYKLWQIIEEGPRKGEEYVAAYLDLNFTLEQLEADLALMKEKLGKE
ncbi:MAG: PKD domain-containing protein [Candidatus Caldatribacteriaceae bacterium]